MDHRLLDPNGIFTDKPFRDFSKEITDKVNSLKEMISGLSEVKNCFDMALTDYSVKPVFIRSSKMRRRKKIFVNRRIATLRQPRNLTLKDCYPSWAFDSAGPGLSDQTGIVTMPVSFDYGNSNKTSGLPQG